MIKVDPCRGCGRLLYSASLDGLTYRAETDPLDAQQALAAVVGGTELYRVTSTSVTSVTPAVLEALRLRGTVEGPTVVRRHVCTVKASEAVSRPRTPSPGPSPQPTPQRPPAGRTTRFSGPSAAPSSVRTAEPRHSEPVCDACGHPCASGTYASIALGELVVWAEHITREHCTP